MYVSGVEKEEKIKGQFSFVLMTGTFWTFTLGLPQLSVLCALLDIVQFDVIIKKS